MDRVDSAAVAPERAVARPIGVAADRPTVIGAPNLSVRFNAALQAAARGFCRFTPAGAVVDRAPAGGDERARSSTEST